jgi:high-affinity nickel-transport protein
VNLLALLALGFFLGMRHATDADHVVAVTTIVSRKRTLAAALPIGALWGLGHTLTIVVVGGAIVLFGVVISPRLGLGMELSVAIMLIVLGAMNVWAFVRDVPALAHDGPDGYEHREARVPFGFASVRPLLVGVVHGLAGSAAVALLVIGTIRNAAWAFAYLLVFCVGTIAGMAIITAVLAVPVVAAAERFARIHRALGVATGMASLAFGAAIAYQIGFVHGFFTAHPDWTPR